MTQQYQSLLANIRHLEAQTQREPNTVSVLAVSKGQSIDKISALYDAGQQSFGENYVDEALNKISALSSKNIVWHYIGNVQSRKCVDIAGNFDWVHSVCRIKEVDNLSKSRHPSKGPLNICLQVNIDKSETKNGLHPEEILVVAQKVIASPLLTLRGLMIFPDSQDSLAAQRQVFKQANNLYETLKNTYSSVDTLSMGMSQDYEAAILEGSTLIRIGQLLFGPRDNLKEKG